VSLTAGLRTVLLCFVLQAGVMLGVPMPPERIRDLLHQVNQPKLAHVLPSEEDDGDPPTGVATSR
jgi:hypothetical protein